MNEETNVQPNFTRILNMDRLSLNDKSESGHAECFVTPTSVYPTLAQKNSKIAKKVSEFVPPVMKNPERFKARREPSVVMMASCEVPDSLLALRAARIMLRRGKSHRPPPSRYVRRQRSGYDPLLKIEECDENDGIEMTVFHSSLADEAAVRNWYFRCVSACNCFMIFSKKGNIFFVWIYRGPKF